MRKALLYGLTMVITILPMLTGCSSEKIKVTFSDKDQTVMIDSSSDTLSEALEDQDLNVAELQKKYQPSIDWNQKVEGQSQIQLACKCKVTLYVGGKKVGDMTTTKTTVGDFLKEQEVTLTAWDEVQASNVKQASLNQKIFDGMTIMVDRVEQRLQKKVEVVKYETKEEESDQLAKGEKETKTKGKPGKTVYEVVLLYKNGKPVLEDGKPVETKKVVETIKPVTEVVIIGTNEELAAKEPPKLASAGSLTVVSTGYTHTGSRTATGTWPKRGTVAVDTDVIPFGTRLYIPGYGNGIAEDTGGAINGNRIDLFFETRAEAIRWGRRTVTIQILK